MTVSIEIDCAGLMEIMGKHCSEEQQKILIAALAKSSQNNAISALAQSCQCSRQTIYTRIKELEALNRNAVAKAQPSQGKDIGRIPAVKKQPGLIDTLECLMEPRGLKNLWSPLYWTTKSFRRLRNELKRRGYEVSYVTVGHILQEMGCNLPGRKKSRRYRINSIWDNQFRHIKNTALAHLEMGYPVISVSCVRKNIIEPFEFQEWHRSAGLTLDSPKYLKYEKDKNYLSEIEKSLELKAINFARLSIAQWWQWAQKREHIGCHESLHICIDNSNGDAKDRALWLQELRKLANQLKILIMVSHLPHEVFKWRSIEYQEIFQRSDNYNDSIPEKIEVIIRKIRSETGVKNDETESALELSKYNRRIEVAGGEVWGHEFEPEWNYLIRPKRKD